MGDAVLLSVVIAVQDSAANLPEILGRLCPGLGDDTEILVCASEEEPGIVLPDAPNVIRLTGRADASIPELWRDGILAARGAGVATLTAHCIPRQDWLDRIRTCDLARYAAFGGRIVEPEDGGHASRAIHRLRYGGVNATDGPRDVPEIAADNALYDREEILRCGDLLGEGFWEPGFHARFRARGRKLQYRHDLVVEHRNRYAPGRFIRQRRIHGRAFGRARGEDAGAGGRLVMLLASPAAFPVHALKVTARILSDKDLRRGFVSAAPWFYLFLANWSLGEMAGYLDAVRGRRGGVGP